MNTPSQKVSYSYDLPQALIATEPVVPRDSCRLFVYHTATDQIALDHFYNIANYIPPQSLMVVNETSVAPSRITLFKSTGGKVICLFLLNEQVSQDDTISLMVDRGVEVGEKLFTTTGTEVVDIVAHQKDSIFYGKLTISRSSLLKLLHKAGQMPIPLYLRKTKLNQLQLKTKYQTIFAQSSAQLSSVAAPTASLHFTPRVFDSLAKLGIQRAPIRLEVGLGTFAPLTDDNLNEGKLHTEWYLVPEQTYKAINMAKANSRAIIAVGTTTVRALESLTSGLSQTGSFEHKLFKSEDYRSTNIFIRPGDKFQYTNHLVTNFHLPNSSLMMMVEALLQSKNAKKSLVQLYQIAIKERFRFYSFGDCMLIL